MMKRTLLIVPAILAARVSAQAQTMTDPLLDVKTYLKGLDSPTGVAFVDDVGTALITQKNDGRVLLIENRKVVGTALDLPVSNDSERGLLSIALSPNFATDKRVYLYHTASTTDGGEPISNKISRYRFGGSKLVFDRKILDLPVSSGPNHDGGKIAFDSKGKLYAVIGDLNRNEVTNNFENAGEVSRRSAILRIQPSGAKIATNPFASTGSSRTAKDDIFAYGIRNSFGIAFDPITGALWDTENGPSAFDEINRVDAGFNSGWEDIQGPVSRNDDASRVFSQLGPKARYSDPEFSWADPVAPTDLHFIGGNRLGSSYRNDLIVGDVNTGTLFHFELNESRNAFVLNGALADKVADNTTGSLTEQDQLIFGSGFGVTSDLLDGPGGMFALSLSNGALYRINERTLAPSMQVQSLGAIGLPEPGVLWIASIALLPRRRQPSVA